MVSQRFTFGDVKVALHREWILSRAGDGPLAEMPYVAALLWTVGAAIAVTIVLSIAAELATPKDSRRKDERYSPSLEMAFQIARVFKAPLDDVFKYPDGEKS